MTITYVNFTTRRRGKNPEPGKLLNPHVDPELAGKYRIRIVNSFTSRTFGNSGYCDFIEKFPGYFNVYFPGVGYATLSKAAIVMWD